MRGLGRGRQGSIRKVGEANGGTPPWVPPAIRLLSARRRAANTKGKSRATVLGGRATGRDECRAPCFAARHCAIAVIWYSGCCREELADLGNERVLVGELTGLLFRVDILAVDPDLEDAAPTGDEANAAERVLIVVRDLFRQTDGFGEVPSSGAVFDLELHDALRTMCQRGRAARAAICR